MHGVTGVTYVRVTGVIDENWFTSVTRVQGVVGLYMSVNKSYTY